MEPKKLIPIFVAVLIFAVGYFVVFLKDETSPAMDAKLKEQSLLGTDSDNNGIRDDIDQFIASKYGTSAVATKAAQTSARAHQRVMMTDPSDKVASRVAMEKSGEAGECAGIGFEKAELDSGRELNEIFFRTFNSPERLAHKQAIVGSAGVFMGTIGAICE